MKELLYLNKFFYKYRWRLILGIVFVIVSNYFRVLQPQVIREAMDIVVVRINEVTGLEDGMIKDSIMSKVGWDLAYFGLLTLIYALLMGVLCILCDRRLSSCHV